MCAEILENVSVVWQNVLLYMISIIVYDWSSNNNGKINMKVLIKWDSIIAIKKWLEKYIKYYF